MSPADAVAAGLMPKRDLLDWLVRVGFASPVAVQHSDGTTRTDEFFVLDLAGAAEAEVHPFELLLSYRPAGVVCFFSAVSFHALTRRIPSHHHVAELQRSPIRRVETEEPAPSTRAPRAPPNPLGKPAFSYQETCYYVSKRLSSRMPGIQTRDLSARSRYCITTLEQTLLDTLSRPFQCGGPETVFEAWSEGLGRLDEKRLVEYLAAIGSAVLSRRVGAMLESFDYKIQGPLLATLEAARQSPTRSDGGGMVPLLAGMAYTTPMDRWKILGP
ncbi:MAG: hypothetical protein HYZ53_20715 [Planctomycetes bacterium]|nr:hypothetical protein [Planctomycetota bacterium]